MTRSTETVEIDGMPTDGEIPSGVNMTRLEGFGIPAAVTPSDGSHPFGDKLIKFSDVFSSQASPTV